MTANQRNVTMKRDSRSLSGVNYKANPKRLPYCHVSRLFIYNVSRPLYTWAARHDFSIFRRCLERIECKSLSAVVRNCSGYVMEGRRWPLSSIWTFGTLAEGEWSGRWAFAEVRRLWGSCTSQRLSEISQTYVHIDIHRPFSVFLNLEIGDVSRNTADVFVDYRIMLLMQSILCITVSLMTSPEREHVWPYFQTCTHWNGMLTCRSA